jgi:hypothetical protein
MRVEDAPPAGWYPDPEGGSRLRWWEGTDWADRWRAPPTPGVVEIKTEYEATHGEHGVSSAPQGYPQLGGLSRRDTDEIINQVRMAARAEAERAATLFGQQARSATQNIGPLISQYTNRFVRWFRILSVIAIVFVVLWIAWQVFAQVSLFEWIGDRIDNLTDDESGASVQLLVGLVGS